MQKMKCYGFKYMNKECLHHYFHLHIKILHFMVVLIVHILTNWLINVDNFVQRQSALLNISNIQIYM